MYIYMYIIYICIFYIFYIYIYIYIWYSFWAKVFRFHKERWLEWDSNQRPRSYFGKVLTTGYLAELGDVLNGLQHQVNRKLKSSLDDCSGPGQIKLAVNFLYFLCFQPRSKLISGWSLHQWPHYVFFIYIYGLIPGAKIN